MNNPQIANLYGTNEPERSLRFRAVGDARIQGPAKLTPALVFVLAAVVALSGLGTSLAQGAASFVVIVHPDNSTGTASNSELSDIYLKKKTQWPNGSAIEAVNLSGEPEVREAFSRAVHQRSTANISSFWNQELFAGRAVPPLELGSSDAVVQYVASHSGAIGYVAAGRALDGVRVLSVLTPPRLIQRVDPNYPATARAARVSGDVVLSIEVGKDGRVSRVNVVKELPFGLTREAIRVVEQWRFEPATVNGRPVSQELEVSVHFGAPGN